MKTLLLLRHAKSDWSHDGQPDHDRTLNARGKRDAPRIGQLLQAQGLLPDRILSSTAKRARKTARKVVAGGDLTASIEQLDSLYLASPTTYVTVLQQQDDAVACILVVGHNPGIEQLSQRLTGRNETFATGTLAHIDLEIARWAEVSCDSPGVLRNIWRPREREF